MEEKKLINKLEELFKSEASGHDISHLIRTCNIAKHLQKIEGGDSHVIAVSALLHDVHRLIQSDTKETGSFCEPKDSLSKVKKILQDLETPSEIINKVLHCIEFHEEYDFSKSGKSVNDIETLILQDADNLDAIGAVGIARAFAFGGANNVPIWTPEIPFERENFDEGELDPSEIHHFHSKLLKLKDNMNTETARKMAEERTEFMKNFLDHFFKEWSGEL